MAYSTMIATARKRIGYELKKESGEAKHDMFSPTFAKAALYSQIYPMISSGVPTSRFHFQLTVNIIIAG